MSDDAENRPPRPSSGRRHGDAPPDALAGIRVLDLSAVLAAPVAATLLGDFGAEVIKVEEPRTGDFPRRSAPMPGGRTPLWAQEGRNKASITLDLRRAEGQEIARRLAAVCDVVVTNFRPRTAEKWGLSPERLLEVDDRLVVLSITGYGLTGPYRDRGAFDRVACAYSGQTYVSGYPEHPPVRCGFAVVDFMTAYLGAFAVLAALRARDLGHGGQYIDLALYEAAFRATEGALADYAASGVLRERVGNRNPSIVPASDATARDGKRVSYHAGTPPLLARLTATIGRPELASDPRFATLSARVANQEELYAIIDAWIAGRDAHEVVDRLSAADVPAAVVNSMADILYDEHFLARRTFELVDDPDLGVLPIAAPVPRLSGTPGRIRELGAELGSSTNRVLGDLLGLESTELERLAEEGVI